MPEYSPYYGMTSLMRRLEKTHNLKALNHYDELMSIGHTLLCEGKFADFFTALIEANHYFTSHQVLLLGKNLSEMLYRSKLKLRLDNLRLPFSTFEVDFDKTMKVPNTDIPMPSVLCSFYETQASREFAKKFCQDITKKFNLKTNLEMQCPQKLIAFRMADPKASDFTVKPMLIFNLDPDWCKDKDIEEIIEQSPVLKTADVPLNQEENQIMKAVVKLTFGALCYLNLKNREAEAAKAHNRPRIGIPPSVLLLGKRCISSTFMRDGHIRTLAHERFRRDEYGFPRLIWIREHLVNPQGNMHEKDAQNITLEDMT